MAAAPTVELDDQGWADVRDAMARRFLGVDADEFVRRFKAGDYDADEPDFLMDVLAYFPELD